MLKKVLIATDGSEAADKAVRIGAQLAAMDAAEVVLVHVLLRGDLSENLRHMAEIEYEKAEGGKALYDAIAAIPDARFPVAELVPRGAQTQDDLLKAVADSVLSRAEQAVREQGVETVSRQIEDGDPARRVVEVAQDTGADMIVTGARGLSDLKAAFLGSVSHKISNLSPVTCVNVR